MPIGVALIRPSAVRHRGCDIGASHGTAGAEPRADLSGQRRARGPRRYRRSSAVCAPSVSCGMATAAPAPPAPNCTTRRSGTSGSPRRKLSAKPNQSVLWPMRLPSRSSTVFTAPSARASGDSSCSSGMTACLHGCVMFSAGESHAFGRGQQIGQRIDAQLQLLPGRSACRCSAGHVRRLPPRAGRAPATPGCRRRSGRAAELRCHANVPTCCHVEA